MIYGTPQIQIVHDTTDLIGIRVLILSKLWQPSRANLSQIEIDAERPPAPAVPGGVLLVGDQTRRSEGAMRTTWTFQGIHGDGKSTTFRDRSNSIDYGFEAGFAQVPIQLHPEFKTLKDVYGGIPDNEGSKVIWQPTLPGKSTGSNGLSGATDPKDLNPMFGVQDFYRMEGTYRFRYAERNLPANLFFRVGKIFSTGSLPGRPPTQSGGRNWLKLPPNYHRRGLIFDITETYWLSGPGGWPEPVYGGDIGPETGTDAHFDEITWNNGLTGDTSL